MKKPIYKYAKIAPRMKNPCDGFIPVYARDDRDKYLEYLQASHYTENVDQGMANKKLQEEIAELKALCAKYQKQVKELTQKCDKERLKWGMEEYYLTQKINDFEWLCKQNNIDFALVNERDAKRRKE